MTLDTIIQPYNSVYRDFVRALCCDTAFMGLPVERAFCDRELYADLQTTYYTDKEPTSCFVAFQQTVPVGYLIGCKKTEKYNRLIPFLVLYPILKGLSQFLIGCYDEKTQDLARWFFTEGYAQIPKTPSHAAHFHITINKYFRIQGIGTQLVETFETLLRKEQQKTCFVQVFSSQTMGALHFFKRLGYHNYDSKKFTGFNHFIFEDVFLYTLVKHIC